MIIAPPSLLYVVAQLNLPPELGAMALCLYAVAVAPLWVTRRKASA